MSHRKLEVPGFFAEPPPFDILFEGKRFAARPGEPLVVTLMAHGRHVLGRSSKYHRARGAYCGRGHCGRCLARVDGHPNTRSCLELSHADAKVESQHVMGSAKHDLLGALDWMFPQGLDHHTLMTESTTLNRMAVAAARRLAGHGELPALKMEADPHEVAQQSVPVLVIGGGQAGRAAHAVLTRAGVASLLIDAAPDAPTPALAGARAVGLYDDRDVLVLKEGRLIRVQAEVCVLATGAMEPAPTCDGNDAPGLITRRLCEQALRLGVRPGRRIVMATQTNADDDTMEAARTLATSLTHAGVSIELALNLGELAVARRSLSGQLAALAGRGRVQRVQLVDEDETFEADAVVWCPAPVPDYALARQMGIATPFDATRGAFVPVCEQDGRTSRPGVLLAGEIIGLGAHAAEEHGRRVGETALTLLPGTAGAHP